MGSFDGVAEIYRKSRHGYPAELRHHLIDIGALGPDSFVVDLGAGTGQLAILVSETARSIVAIDPERDMVEVGRQATRRLGRVRWLTGSDSDLLRIVEPPIDLVLIGNAFHHMSRADLLRDLDSLVSDEGSVVVCSSSIPVWLQDTDWSRALHAALSKKLGRPVGSGGVPDHQSDVEALLNSPFSVVETWTHERTQPRSAESILGEVASSTSDTVDGEMWNLLAASLKPHLTDGAVNELVKTTALVARRMMS